MESIAIAMRGKFIEIQARQQGQRTQQMAAIAEENENWYSYGVKTNV